MDEKITEIAQRIKTLREILEVSLEDMAQATNVSPEEYKALEDGENDFSFTFLHKAANRLGVDLTDILTGETAKLSFYAITRKGKGVDIKRRKGFTYQHLAYQLKSKKAQPFIVTAPYDEAEQTAAPVYSQHKGQEFDLILQGSLRIYLENHTEILHEGDSIMYDSGHRHGMIATDHQDCVFLAMVID